MSKVIIATPDEVLDGPPLIRTTERSDFLRCQYKWWWSWQQGLRKRGEMPTALWFGIGMHEALAAYYGPGTKRFPKRALKVWEDYCAEEFRWIHIVGDYDEEGRDEGATLGRTMLEGYFDKYKGDKNWRVIQMERSFQINVRSPKTGKIVCVYAGTYDGVYRDLDTGLIWLPEHKNYKAINTRHLVLDRQVGSYLWVATEELRGAGLIGPKERINGVMYNILRKGTPDERTKDDQGYAVNKPTKAHFLNRLGHLAPAAQLTKLKLDELEAMATAQGITVLGDRSKIQPAPLFHREPVYRTPYEQFAQARRVLTEAREMDRKRAGKGLTKNTTQNCSWDCSFFDMCTLHEAGGDWQGFRDAIYDKIDPYADHRSKKAM